MLKRFSTILLASVLLSGCMTTSKISLVKPQPQDKVAGLEFTDVGTTSTFKFDHIATGTYKSLGSQAGLVVHAGEHNIEINLNAAQKWNIKATSKKKAIKTPYGGVNLQNPYLAVVKRKGRTIGKIGLNLPKINKRTEMLKLAGLDTMTNTNLELSGGAKILGVRYKLKSVYKDATGKKSSAPLGYKVMRGRRTLGTVSVSQNMFGGQKLTLWIKGKLPAKQEQSVVSILLVAGWAI